MLRRFDDVAVDIIPVRLIVSIAIIAAIAVLIAIGFHNLSISSSENQVEQECKGLISSLNSMVSKGEPRDLDDLSDDVGSTRVKEFELPDNLLYLSFGVDPDPFNNGRIHTGLTDNGTVIFYRVEGGSKKTIWLDEEFRLREGTEVGGKWFLNPLNQGYIIRDGGETTLTFELVSKNTETFILIHANDKIII